MCRTGAACRFSKLYSQRSVVCARELQIIHCVRRLQLIVEWPELRHVVHCRACRNLNSSSFGSARYNIPIDMKELVLSISNTRSITWSNVLFWKSRTPHIVRSGSLSATKKTALASSSGGALLNWLCKVWNRIINCSIELTD
jgi:hypothetical protein